MIGIDDFAWRRGHSYGSIVVDLERRTVIDILPDRQRDTVMAWLRENRQVRIICRDRGPGYGAAAAEAAPQARQVADRWHLFENASAAFLSAVRSELPRLRKALSPETPVDPVTLSKAERIQWEAAMTREAINAQVLALAAQGIPLKAMARTTGLSRQTIRKIVRGQRHDMFRTRQSSLDPWRVRLEAEWTGGCRVGAELWRRLRASGFAGSLRVVGEWATRRRRDDRLGQPAGPSLSARTIARGLTVERDTGSARIALVNATIETAAPELIAAPDPRAITLGADEGNGAADFVEESRTMNVRPHVAQKRHSAIDGRTTRHAGYATSQRIRKRIEEAVGRIKTIGGLCKTQTRSISSSRPSSGQGGKLQFIARHRLARHPPRRPRARTDRRVLLGGR